MLPQPNFVYCLWHKIWATGYDLVDKVTVSNDDDIIPLSLYDCFKGFWAIWTTTNLEKLREKKKAVNYFLKSSILDVWLGSEYVSQILGFTKYCLRCDSYQNTTAYLKLLLLNKYANVNKKMGRSHKVFIFWNLTGKHNNIKFRGIFLEWNNCEKENGGSHLHPSGGYVILYFVYHMHVPH